MSDDRAALEAAAASWINARVDPMPRACRAYHRAMIKATPGLCVHEADGTVRAATAGECRDASRAEWERKIREHIEAAPSAETPLPSADKLLPAQGSSIPTVTVPTYLLRFKAGRLQQMHRDVGGGHRNYWVNVPNVADTAPDVETTGLHHSLREQTK